MLTDEIIDSARELAERDALWQEKQDDEILRQVKEKVQENLSLGSRFGKLAVGAYRYYERKVWARHNNVQHHSPQEV